LDGAATAPAGGAGGFLAALRSPYRPGQGAVTRRIASAVGAGLSLWGAYDLWVWLAGFGALSRPLLAKPVLGADLSRLPLGGPPLGGALLIAAAVGAAGWIFTSWFLKRPWLADLLIETEGEMKKVSWPGREEAWSATRVVTVTVAIFTVVLFVCDLALTGLMKILTGWAL
jgi:preprotein translocase SecE subunit